MNYLENFNKHELFRNLKYSKVIKSVVFNYHIILSFKLFPSFIVIFFKNC